MTFLKNNLNEVGMYKKRFPIFIILLSLLLTSLTFSQIRNQKSSSKTENNNIEILETEIDSLKNQIKDLKFKQDATLEAAKTTLDNLLKIFTIIGVLATIILGVIAGLQRRQHKELIDENNRRWKLIDDIQRSQKEDNSKLYENYNENIRSITSLITALKSVFEFQADFENIKETIKSMVEKNEDESDYYKNRIQNLNKEAMEISRTCKRHSYTQKSFQEKFSRFVEEYHNILSSYTDHSDFNANCYYILGLEARTHDFYNEAIKYLDKSIEIAKNDMENESRLSCYPGLSLDKLQSWTKKLINVCNYHLCIMKYNLGKYSESLELLDEAIEYDSRDFKAMIYRPEAMFLGHLRTFHIIEEEFDSLVKELEDLEDTSGFSETKEQLLSQLKLRFANCYFGRSTDPEYRNNRNIEKAIELLEDAFKLTPNSYIIQFSLAQALVERNNSGDSTQATKLFKSVYVTVIDKLTQVTEVKILIMLYYILAICIAEGKVAPEPAKIYILRIFELIPSLPPYPDLRIFSPLSKNDLILNEFKEEINKFQDTGSMWKKDSSGKAKTVEDSDKNLEYTVVDKNQSNISNTNMVTNKESKDDFEDWFKKYK